MTKLIELKDFPGYYVSDDGFVYSSDYMHTGKMQKLVLHKDKNGYLRCLLYSGGKRKLCGVHRLVAESFILNLDNKPQVNHKNGIKDDNRTENLEFVTASENVIHRFNALHQKGSMFGHTGKNCHNSKIVLQIKNGVIVAEFYGSREAARQTGISFSGISNCCKKRKHYNTAGGYQWKYKE